ncbi:MAG: hypothetical protein IT572_09370 [Deltaproteobacteria bacterium]|nr:hypothetical protein [Deltaproteobacteria bacterium]
MAKKKEKYRLQPLLDVRIRNKRNAEIALGKAFKILKEEQEKLVKLEEEKRAIIKQREDARKEMAEMLRMGESVVADSHGHINFIKRLQEDEEKKDQEIEDQKIQIEKAEERVASAKRDYIDACKEVKIMEKHKELWQKKVKQKLEYEEAKLMNELGNVGHQLRKMRG